MKRILLLATITVLFCFLVTGCSNKKTEGTVDSTTENIVESTVATNQNMVELNVTTTQNVASTTVTTTETTTQDVITTTVATTEMITQDVVTTTVTTTEMTTHDIATTIPSTTETTIQNVVESTVTTTTSSSMIETTTEESQSSGVNNITTTTQKNNSNVLISDEDMEKIENSNAEVFFSDNPENEYIIAISNKYGSKKENLVALIKVNAEFPSVYVFEFSGKRDSNDELIMSYEELKYVYEINETKNTIIKASKSGLDNDGVNFLEAKVLITLAKDYFIPELPNLKVNKRYPE